MTKAEHNKVILMLERLGYVVCPWNPSCYTEAWSRQSRPELYTGEYIWVDEDWHIYGNHDNPYTGPEPKYTHSYKDAEDLFLHLKNWYIQMEIFSQ